MMNIEEKVKETISLYEKENSTRGNDFKTAQNLFDDLVKRGIVEKRGNQLAEITQRTDIHVKFN